MNEVETERGVSHTVRRFHPNSRIDDRVLRDRMLKRRSQSVAHQHPALSILPVVADEHRISPRAVPGHPSPVYQAAVHHEDVAAPHDGRTRDRLDRRSVRRYETGRGPRARARTLRRLCLLPARCAIREYHPVFGGQVEPMIDEDVLEFYDDVVGQLAKPRASICSWNVRSRDVDQRAAAHRMRWTGDVRDCQNLELRSPRVRAALHPHGMRLVQFLEASRFFIRQHDLQGVNRIVELFHL